MRKSRVSVLVLLLILVVSLPNGFAFTRAAEYSWPFLRHDPQNTGFIEGSAPSSNDTLWTANVSTVYISSLGYGGYPVYSNGKLFAIGNYTLLAFNATNGEVIWQTEPVGGTGLAVAYGMVFVGSGSGLVAFDENSGKEIYSVQVSTSINLELQAINAVDGKLFISSHDEYTHCVNASNGEVLWRTKTYRFGSHAPPAVSDGLVFQGAYCLNESDGSIVWRYDGYYGSTPSVADGKVFLFAREIQDVNTSASIVCLNQQTGQVVWEYPIGVFERFNYNPSLSRTAVAYGRVFAVVNGTLYALDENTGELIWARDNPDRPLSGIPPVVADHRVFVADHDYILGLDTDSGEVVWIYALSGARNPHIVADGKLFAMNADSLIAIPEFPFWVILAIIAVVTVVLALVCRLLRK